MFSLATGGKTAGKAEAGLSVTSITLLMFLTIIGTGTFLLMLPMAQAKPVSFIDALFTATSATCVTGLLTINTAELFTTFGQVIIMLLIELGAIGIITVSTFFLLAAGKSISLKNSSVIHDTFTASNRVDIKKLIRSVFVFLLLFEVVGSLIFIIIWSEELGIKSAIFHGIFHAVSAFCNAGITSFSGGLDVHLGKPSIAITIMVLFICGGIGFLTIGEVVDRIKLRKSGKRREPSLQLKVVLFYTFVSIFIGSLAILILEWNNINTGLSFGDKVLSSLFHISSARTAGFAYEDISSFNDSSICIMIILMFIGGGPISTSGGIKVTSLAVLIAMIRPESSGSRIRIFNRSLPWSTVTRVISILLISIIVLIIGIFTLLSTEAAGAVARGHYDRIFLDVIFEAVSAFGTVGLSLGLTPDLSTAGKLIITLLMLLGRIGPLTIAMSILNKGKEKQFEMAEESMMVG